MRILTRYIATDFMFSFGLTLLVFTFVMSVASVVKIIDLMARGVSASVLVEVFLMNIPFMLNFSMPISALATTLLLFTRLSMDGEITAMKACGLSLWQVVSPVIFWSVILSAASMYVSNELSPRCRYQQRFIVRKFTNQDPVALLEEGRFVREFPNAMIYIGGKNRDQVTDVIIYEMGERGHKQTVRARRGRVYTKPEAPRKMFVDLYDVRIDRLDPADPNNLSLMKTMVADYHNCFPEGLDLEKAMKSEKTAKKITDQTLGELTQAIRDIRAAYPDLQEKDLRRMRMSMLIEANSRMALSIGCFAFCLLGIPLGIRSRRRESSAGIVLSLVIVFIAYFFMILASSLKDHPEWRPDLIVWLPIVTAEIMGFLMIRKMN